MEPIDIAAVADDFDREVAATPEIDRFCSSSAWILAAATALMPPRAPFSFHSASGYFAAMRGVHAAGFPYIEPVELAWGLAAPLIGHDPAALAEDVVALLAARRDWQLAILAGLTAGGPQRRALDRVLPPRWERRRGTPTVRHVASLDGGVDGFLSRRPRELRKSLRKSLRAAVQAGVTFESVRQAPAEAAHGDRDIGYILGAVMAGEYRGLQFSYDDDHAELGIGGLLQYHQITLLCSEGVTRYDLGTEMDYKRRWAEEVMETEMLVLVR